MRNDSSFSNQFLKNKFLVNRSGSFNSFNFEGEYLLDLVNESDQVTILHTTGLGVGSIRSGPVEKRLNQILKKHTKKSVL